MSHPVLTKEEIDVNEKLKNLCEEDMKDIIKNVCNELESITFSENCSVVIIGETQVGKSTLINALLGFEFKTIKDEKTKKYIHVITEESEKKMARMNIKPLEMGNEMSSETMYPGRYSDKLLSYDILDTRGYRDSKLEANGVIASSILVDAYLHNTDSVQLVYVNKYSNYCDLNIYDMMPFVNSLSSKNIKMFFVANRYKPATEDEWEEYRSYSDEQFDMEMDNKLREDFTAIYEEQIKEILKAICSTPRGSKLNVKIEELNDLTRSLDEMFEPETKELEKKKKEIEKKTKELYKEVVGLRDSLLRETIGNKNSDLKEAFDKFMFLNILKRQCDENFNENRMIYVDPFRPASVKRLRDLFADISCKKTEDIHIPPYLPPRIITISSTVDKTKIFMNYFLNETFIYTYLLQAYVKCIYLPKGLDMALEGYNDMIKELEEDIKTHTEEVNKTKESAEVEEIQNHEYDEIIKEIDQRIKRNEDKKKLKEEEIKETLKIDKCKYGDPVPVLKDTDYYENECIIDENYDVELEDYSFKPHNEDTKKVKCEINGKHFYGVFRAPDENLTSFKRFIRWPTFGLSTLFYSIHPCDGEVTLYVKHCNLPEVIQKRKDIENDIKEIEEEIKKDKEDINVYENLKKEENTLDRLSTQKKIYLESKKEIEEAIKFRNECKLVFYNNCTLIKLMLTFIKKLKLNEEPSTTRNLTDSDYPGLFNDSSSSSSSSTPSSSRLSSSSLSSSSSSSGPSKGLKSFLGFGKNQERNVYVSSYNTKTVAYNKFISLNDTIDNYNKDNKDEEEDEESDFNKKVKAKKIFSSLKGNITDLREGENYLKSFNSKKEKK